MPYLLPVQTELAKPIKIVDIIAAHLVQLVDDVTGMHLDRHQGHNFGALVLC